MLDHQKLQREKYKTLNTSYFIAKRVNLQTLNTYVFSTTRKQQTSLDRKINIHPSKICPVGVEQQNTPEFSGAKRALYNPLEYRRAFAK